MSYADRSYSSRRILKRSSRRSKRIGRSSTRSSRTSGRSSHSSRRSSRSSCSSKIYVKSSRLVLKKLWKEYRALEREKRHAAWQKKTQTMYLESGLVVMQALSLAAVVIITIFAAIRNNIDDVPQLFLRAFFELLLTVVVVGTINRQRVATRTIVASLYVVALVADAYLLEQKMRQKWSFLCKKNDKDCVVFVGFNFNYISTMICCTTLHAFGVVLAILALNKLSQANQERHAVMYMRMAISKNKRLRRRQRQLIRMLRKQKESLLVLSCSELSTMMSEASCRASSRTKSSRSSKNFKRSSRRPPAAYSIP